LYRRACAAELVGGALTAVDAGDRVKIEVLQIDGCPRYARLLPVVRALADAYSAELVRSEIATVDQAERAGFLGSPTVRVDGVDVDPGAGDRSDFGRKCRLYGRPGGRSGGPPSEWIERALWQAAAA
jgi:hypothetical protein